MIVVNAPAKINITLEVLRKRPDGYHEIRSIMQAISLSDTLVFTEADRLKITSDDVKWDGTISLVAKAASLLRERTGIHRGASILVQKRIPLLAGLGGDSSDTAAALTGLNEIWSLGLNRDDLLSVGRELGSDIAFFFYGGTALATGRGEIITPLPSFPHRWIVLIVPDTNSLPGKTKTAYQSLNPENYTEGNTTNEFIDRLISRTSMDDTLFVNVFEKVAELLHPGLKKIHRQLLDLGISGIHLAGSGPTLYRIYSDQKEAEYTLSKLSGLDCTCYLTETI
jgi:4-diphosphocytidyl-2-C-methyl-D-erythritol kinase